MPRTPPIRRPMSMTPLVDVIFLLLMFFMLSSTFSRFSEIEIGAAASGSSELANNVTPLFLRLGKDSLTLNGRDIEMDGLDTAVLEQVETGLDFPVLISINIEVTAQRLTDILVILRSVQGAKPVVLGK